MLTVELAGTNQFQMFAMVNIKKNSCPIGYKNMDQVISLRAHDGECERAPDPGLKYQAPSSKRQAASFKLSNQPGQLTSDKHPNHNHKRQATSRK